MKRDLLAIDTGNTELGFAYWRIGAASYRVPTAPSIVGIIKAVRSKRETQADAAINAIGMLRKTLDQCRVMSSRVPHMLVVEGQIVRRDAIGITAQQDIVNLSACVGAMIAMYRMRAMHSRQITRVPCVLLPGEWKGQLSKPNVESRIGRMVGNSDSNGLLFNSHVWDAVGIGLTALGHRIDDPKKVNRK